MEKSSRNAAVTSTTAARTTAPNAAIPARRAVSLRRIEPASRPNKATRPARNEYELRHNASNSAKLPTVDMGGNPGVFFQITHCNATRREAHKFIQSGNLDDSPTGGSPTPPLPA